MPLGGNADNEGSKAHNNVVLRLLIPILRITHDTRKIDERDARHEQTYALVLLDGRWLSKLCRSRPIQIEAYHPHASSVQDLALLLLCLWFGSRDLVKIEIRSDS